MSDSEEREDDPAPADDAAELADVLKKHSGADPEKVQRAKRAFEAALEGDESAMSEIAREMAPPAAKGPWPGPPMPVASRQSGTLVPAQKASSGVWIAVAAGALAVFAGGGFFAFKLLGKQPISATPCGKGALHLIGDLKSPVTVTVYATKGVPKIEQFVEQVGVMMRDLEVSAKGKLVYEVVTVVTDEQRAQAKEAGLQEVTFGEAGKDGASAMISRGFCGIALKYGTEHEVIPVLDADQAPGLPFWIVEKIRELRGRADNVVQRFGVISGKGEIKLSEPNLIASQAARGAGPNMKGILAQALPFYAIDEVDLRGGEQEIDASLSGVLLTQPGTDYTDGELRRIDQFLMRGGKSVVVFASAVNAKPADAKMMGELNLHGLDRLLSGYGVEMAKDVLFDWDSSLAIPTALPSGERTAIRVPGVILAERDEKAAEKDQRLDNTFVPFFRMDQVAFPFASSLVAHPEKQPEARFVTAARTTPKTTSETTSPISLYPTMKADPHGEQRQRVIALGVEGKLRSAFAGTAQGNATAPESSRLLVISSAQFLANPMARAGNPVLAPELAMLGVPAGDEDLQMMAQPYAQKYLTATILAFKNTLDWASADDATVSCSALLIGPKDKDK